MRPLIQAILIHHRLPTRAENRKQIRSLMSQLDFQLLDIVDQPMISAEPPSMGNKVWIISRLCFKSGVDALLQGLRGRKYLLRSLWSFMAEVTRTVVRLGSAAPEAWISAYRTCLVETILVDKHFQAWEAALKARADWLLVLEDDAKVLPDTCNRLQHLLDHDLTVFGRDCDVYCDLAGGFEPQVVLPNSAVWDGESQRWSIPFVQTNTTCSYLASHSLAMQLVSTVQRFPVLRQLPADHLINVASLLFRNQRHSSLCLHWQHPMFLHGSFHAGLSSSISDIRRF